MLQPPQGPKSQLFPESPTRFFMKVAPIEIEFTQGDKGEITGLIVHQQGPEFKATKTN